MNIPSFPEFSPLALNDKQEYERLIDKYPPFSDISFATLHIWWNLEEKLGLSSLDGNLVLNYCLPFDSKNSGWCLIGKNNVDKSIKEIFAHLKQQNRDQKLVHVPDFVIEEVEDKQSLVIEEESDYHEYVCDSRQLASLEGHSHSRTRRKVNRFLREVDERSLELKELNIGDPEIMHLINSSIEKWQPNRLDESDPGSLGIRAIKHTLDHSDHFETKNLALFVGGQLQGIVLYHLSHDKKHYIITHLRVDYSIPFIFDYMTNQMAVVATKDEVPYLNMEMDLGLEGLRQHKLGLRPVIIFKKYTIRLA